MKCSITEHATAQVASTGAPITPTNRPQREDGYIERVDANFPEELRGWSAPRFVMWMLEARRNKSGKVNYTSIKPREDQEESR